jgi:FKBP-type peptidyl-prolyl cis-trans isomerase 2
MPCGTVEKMSEVEGREEAKTGESPEEEDVRSEDSEPDAVEQDAEQEEDTPPDSFQKPKVRMPQAKEIRRSEFTPHALGAKGRSAPRSGTRAAAKRRQIIYSVIAGVVVLGLVGFAVWWETRPAPSVKFKGAFGKAPVASVPKAKPAAKKNIKELIPGSGAKVTANDYVIAHLVGYTWSASGGKEVLNTYKKNKPVGGSASQLTGLPALDKALVGHPAGTRLQLTLPYADVGDQIAQALKMGKTDDLAVAVDVLKTYGKTATVQGTGQPADAKLPQVSPGAPGQAPTIKIPSSAPPSALQVTTLVQGTGKTVAKGETLVGQYDGVLWRTGKEFDSSYKHGAPAGFPIGVGQVIPGWDKALVGKKAGSRVMIVVPPKDGYGATGQPEAGIKGTDTLVFVIDILDSF